MNRIFSIAAKNYLAQALTLGDSLKRTNPEVDFTIFLADENEDFLGGEKYRIIEAKNLGIHQFEEMAFQYDVLEFSCAIKPFCVEYLFNQKSADKVVYLDPDISVYSSLNPIWEMLDDNFLVLSPHLIHLSSHDDGSTPESVLLFCGTYNLGFAAFRDTKDCRQFLDWWKERLTNKAYVDKQNGYHVDQKWIDLVPAAFDKGVCVARHPGINASHWNMHERRFSKIGINYFVDNAPLIFYHFSSLDPHCPEKIATRQTRFDFNNRPEYRELFEDYALCVLRNKYDQYSMASYAYSKFENGINIISLYRRIYRSLKESGETTGTPFLVGPNSFFNLLEKNRMMIYDHNKSGEYGKKDYKNSGWMIDRFIFFMKLIKKAIGIKYYHMLIKQFYKYSRQEEQVFLIEKTIRSNSIIDEITEE